MKNILVRSVLGAVIVLSSIAASAASVKISCEEGKSLARSEQIQALTYNVDLKALRGSVVCKDASECGTFGSLDFMAGVQLKNSWGCETRKVFNFLLTQEDEFDNFVTLTIIQDCESKVTDVNAVITNNDSGGLPQGAEAVTCKVL